MSDEVEVPVLTAGSEVAMMCAHHTALCTPPPPPLRSAGAQGRGR